MSELPPNYLVTAQDTIPHPDGPDLLRDMNIIEATPEKIFLGSLNGLLRGTIENLDDLKRSLDDKLMVGLLREKIHGHEDRFNIILSEAHDRIFLRLQDSRDKNDHSATALCEQAIALINKVMLITTRGLVTVTPRDDTLTPFGGPSTQDTREALLNANSQISLEASLVGAYDRLSQNKKLLADKLKNFLNGDNISTTDLQALCKDIVMDRDGDEVKNYLQKQSSFSGSIISLVDRVASVKEGMKSETDEDTATAMKNRVDAEEKLIDYLYNVSTDPSDFVATVESFDAVAESNATIQVSEEQRIKNVETVFEPLFQSGGAAPDFGAILIALVQPNNGNAIESLGKNPEFIAKIVVYVKRLILMNRGTVSPDDLAAVAGIKKAFTDEQVQDVVNQLTGDVVNAQQSQNEVPQATGESSLFVEKPEEREKNNLTVEAAAQILLTGEAFSITKNAEQIKLLFVEKKNEILKEIKKKCDSQHNIEVMIHLLESLNEDEDKTEKSEAGDGRKVNGIFENVITSLKKLLREMSPVGDGEKPQVIGAEASNDSAVPSLSDQRALEKENAENSFELLHNLNFEELYQNSALILENLSIFGANLVAEKVTNEAEKKIRATKKGILREKNTLENKEHKEDGDNEKIAKLEAFLGILNQFYPRIQIEASSVSKLGSVLRGFATKTRARIVGGIKQAKEHSLKKILEKTDSVKEKMLNSVKALKDEMYGNLREGFGMKRTVGTGPQLARIEPVLDSPVSIQAPQAEALTSIRTPEAEKAEKRVYLFIKSLPEKYEKLEPKTKLVLSASLIGLGFVGTALSVAPVIATVGVAKVVLRGFSAIAAAKGAQKFIEASRLNENWKKDANKIGWGVGLAVFALGSIHDFHHFGTWVSEHISFGVPASEMAGGIEKPSASTASSASLEKITEISTDHDTTDTVSAIMVGVAPGDTATKLLIAHKDVIRDMLVSKFGDNFNELNSEGIKNLIGNLSFLSAEELRAIGFSSGDINRLVPEDKINLEKLVGLAKKYHVQYSIPGVNQLRDGGSFLDRMLSISINTNK